MRPDIDDRYIEAEDVNVIDNTDIGVGNREKCIPDINRGWEKMDCTDA